jgi:MYXO-CTERM domain-containing protein
MTVLPLCLSSLLALALPSVASATGLGNLTYTAAELEKPIANFGGTGAYKFPSGPSGSNTALMLRDVFIIMGSNDSGKPPGSFHFYDIKDPRNPKLLNTLGGTPETNDLRELHAMPVAMIGGKDYTVFPSTSGIRFFDFTDPMAPAAVGYLALAGANGGDYDNANWMLSWAWPYVYVGSTGNGIFIVDATDPSKPSLVKRVTTGEMGNFRIGPTYAAGNYAVVLNMDQAPTHVSVLDVGTPSAPFLLTTGTTTINLYSAVVIGDRIYGPGTNGDYAFMKWSPTSIGMVASKKSGSDRGGYCTYQSGIVICGQSSEGYKKWSVQDEANITQVGHGTDPNGVGGDFDFATIFGNLVYLGNDHGSGAALIPHQMAPDTTAPAVLKVYPNDQDVKQPLSTRVTIFFTEDIDLGTVNPTNIIVRKSGGAALDGVFSKSSFNAISFGARAPLEANTTYEVVIPAGGLKDLVGNTLTTAATSRFSTGATITPGTTGAGGATVPAATGGAGGAGKGTGGAGGGGPGAGGARAGTGGTTPSGSGGSGATANGTGGATPASGSGGSAASSGGSSGTLAGTGGGSPASATSGGATVVVYGTGGSGVASASGGAPGASSTSGGSGGCSCSVPGGGASGGGLLLVVAGLWIGARRKRAKRIRTARS